MRISKVRVAGTPLVEIEDAMGYLNADVDNAAEQALVEGLIEAATLDMEAYCSRDVARYTYNAFLSTIEFGLGKELALPETAEISKVAYRNAVGVWTDMATDTDYKIIEDEGLKKLVLLNIALPVSDEFTEVYRVTYNKGYTAETMPQNGKLALKLWVNTLYDVRMEERIKRGTVSTVELMWNAFKNYYL